MRGGGAVLLCALALAGCQPATVGLPPARHELVHRAGEGGVHFTFARGSKDGAVDYGHHVTFLLSEDVRRLAFDPRRSMPEAWSLRWQDAQSKRIHRLVLVVLERGSSPAVELLRPHPKAGPVFEFLPETKFPELGRRIGVYLGDRVRFRLNPDGSVLPLDPRPRPGATRPR